MSGVSLVLALLYTGFLAFAVGLIVGIRIEISAATSRDERAADKENQ